MNNRPSSYLSPKLERRSAPEKGGYGLFARRPVKKGELLTVWGGDVITGSELAQLPNYESQLGIQVEEDLYLVVDPSQLGPADWVNHSCEPNAGLSGQICLVALRDIAAGEEICFDYAMSDGTPYDEFTCNCGTTSCRGRVTGDDWQLPQLWEKYAGYFSPYLQRRIARFQRARANGYDKVTAGNLAIGLGTRDVQH